MEWLVPLETQLNQPHCPWETGHRGGQHHHVPARGLRAAGSRAMRRPRTGARCKSAYYCSRNCQKLDWSRHKVACEVYRKSQKAGRTADARIVPEAAMPAPEAAMPRRAGPGRTGAGKVLWSGAAVALAWWLLS